MASRGALSLSGAALGVSVARLSLSLRGQVRSYALRAESRPSLLRDSAVSKRGRSSYRGFVSGASLPSQSKQKSQKQPLLAFPLQTSAKQSNRSSSLAYETVVPKIKACRNIFHWRRNSFFIFSRIYKHFSRLFMKLIWLVFLWGFPVAE